MQRYCTDKNTTHSYAHIYENILAPYRETANYVFELGVDGGGSLKAWRDYFNIATIMGLDNRQECLFSESRIFTYLGNQDDENSLTSVARALNISYDIIIDDANHTLNSQIMSMFHLWPYVKAGGLYIIEDVQDAKHIEKFSIFANCQVYDLREIKGRYDDIMIVVTKGEVT
jgi:demethylmacrocin O-methyltransferase